MRHELAATLPASSPLTYKRHLTLFLGLILTPYFAGGDFEHIFCVGSLPRIKTQKHMYTFLTPSSLKKELGRGGPLSPLLFALTIEPLAQKICSNRNIKGLDLGGHQQK